MHKRPSQALAFPSLSLAENSILYITAKSKALRELQHPANQAKLLSNNRSDIHMQHGVIHSANVEQRSFQPVLLYRLT
jgi:hypothetical protein